MDIRDQSNICKVCKQVLRARASSQGKTLVKADNQI